MAGTTPPCLDPEPSARAAIASVCPALEERYANALGAALARIEAGEGDITYVRNTSRYVLCIDALIVSYHARLIPRRVFLKEVRNLCEIIEIDPTIPQHRGEPA